MFLLFLVCLGGSLGCSLEIFLVFFVVVVVFCFFLRKVCITLNSPPRTAFAASRRFCMVALSMSFVSRHL